MIFHDASCRLVARDVVARVEGRLGDAEPWGRFGIIETCQRRRTVVVRKIVGEVETRASLMLLRPTRTCGGLGRQKRGIRGGDTAGIVLV
jgi:hypothetical protein